MKVNLIYNSSGPRTPNGATPNQPLAGFDNVGVSVYKVLPPPQDPFFGSKDAARLIQSNGELIGNAQLPSNPLPPGITE